MKKKPKSANERMREYRERLRQNEEVHEAVKKKDREQKKREVQTSGRLLKKDTTSIKETVERNKTTNPSKEEETIRISHPLPFESTIMWPFASKDSIAEEKRSRKE